MKIEECSTVHVADLCKRHVQYNGTIQAKQLEVAVTQILPFRYGHWAYKVNEKKD